VTKERLDLGRRGEALALKKIKSFGYQCIATNYRCSLGEVDLIAKDGDTIVFIEIKTRKGRSLGYAKEAIHEKKKRQLSKVALAYLKNNGLFGSKARFDVVAIQVGAGRAEIELVKNAFDLAYE
jgi:putative endonuclease